MTNKTLTHQQLKEVREALENPANIHIPLVLNVDARRKFEADTLSIFDELIKPVAKNVGEETPNIALHLIQNIIPAHATTLTENPHQIILDNPSAKITSENYMDLKGQPKQYETFGQLLSPAVDAVNTILRRALIHNIYQAFKNVLQLDDAALENTWLPEP